MKLNSLVFALFWICTQFQPISAQDADVREQKPVVVESQVHKGGEYDKGEIIAELDIKKDAWFFDCHFFKDPVMPGSLGVDAMWQLIGFFLGWSGGQGRGRALGGGKIKFSGQVTQKTKLITYHLHIKRVIRSKLMMGIADATLKADDKVIYTGQDLRVGLFTDLSEI